MQPYTADVEFSLHHLGNPHVVMEKPYEIQPLLQIKQPPMSVVEDLQGTSPKLKKAPPRTPTTSTDCLPGHMGVVVSAVFAQTRGSWAERPPVRMKQGWHHTVAEQPLPHTELAGKKSTLCVVVPWCKILGLVHCPPPLLPLAPPLSIPSPARCHRAAVELGC